MDEDPITALRQALQASIRWPTPSERRRARKSFERALDRHLAARTARGARALTPAGQR